MEQGVEREKHSKSTITLNKNLWLRTSLHQPRLIIWSCWLVFCQLLLGLVNQTWLKKDLYLVMFAWLSFFDENALKGAFERVPVTQTLFSESLECLLSQEGQTEWTGSTELTKSTETNVQMFGFFIFCSCKSCCLIVLSQLIYSREDHKMPSVSRLDCVSPSITSNWFYLVIHPLFCLYLA